MPLVILKPDGDGTNINWVPKGGGTNFSEVDEGRASEDGDATENSLHPETGFDPTNGDFYTLDATPGDFDVAIDAQVKAHAHATGVVDDIHSYRMGFYQSNETVHRT